MEWTSQIKPPFGTPLDLGHWSNKGLVALWTMNEGGGNIIFDASGNGNHGTAINEVSWRGGDTYFGTITSYFNILHNPLLDILSHSFSYGVLLLPWASNGAWDSPFYKGADYSTVPGYTMELGSGVWVGLVGDGVLRVSVSLGNEIIGAWVFLFVVVNREKNSLIGYVNGKQSGIAGIASIGNIDSSSKSLRLGWNAKVIISSAYIYNRAISSQEVAYLYTYPWCGFEARNYISSKWFNPAWARNSNQIIGAGAPL